MIDFRERRDRIIESIVSSFIRTAQPVGSEHVARNCGLGLSPATIRNIMKELEDEGYLAQPHTSAGRIPTIKCYRYFVKYIMPEIALSESEIREAKQRIENALREHDAGIFMNHIAKVLSEVTDLIGVAMAPSDDIFSFTEENILHVAGLSRLLIQPEFILFDNTLKLIDLYEHKNEIAKVLNSMARNENEVNIEIGRSGFIDSMLPLSLVSAVYAREHARGAVAVLGPTRIDYPRLAAIVRYTAQVATHYFADS